MINEFLEKKTYVECYTMVYSKSIFDMCRDKKILNLGFLSGGYWVGLYLSVYTFIVGYDGFILSHGHGKGPK